MRRLVKWLKPVVLLAMGCGWTVAALADMEVAPRAAGAPAAVAAEREPQAAKRRREWDRPEGDRLIDRLVANPQFTLKLGLTEATSNKMHDDLLDVQNKVAELDARVRQLSLEQADQMTRFFQSKEISTNSLMALADDIGRARTEQAKLTIRRMMVIRKYLTGDQIRLAREMMRERMQKERDARGEPAVVKADRREKVAAPVPAAQPLTKPPEGW